MASGLRPRPYLSAFRVFGCPQALQGSLSFSCVTGGSHLRLRLDEPPPAICLSSSGLSNSARCARGVETTNCNLWKYEGRIGFTIYNGTRYNLRVPLAYGSQGKRSLSIGLDSALKARAVSVARLGPSCGGAA